MLDPTTLLKERSFFPDRAAVMLTEASGMLVPKATTVRPMMMLGIRRRRAMLELPSTNRSAPLISRRKPRSNKRYLNMRCFPPIFLYHGCICEPDEYVRAPSSWKGWVLRYALVSISMGLGAGFVKDTFDRRWIFLYHVLSYDAAGGFRAWKRRPDRDEDGNVSGVDRI